jgi:hypothetical protein
MTGYGLDGLGIESRLRRDFPRLSRPALGPTQPPVKWVPGLPGGKERPGRDADSSSPSSAMVMKEKSYTSTPPMDRTACKEPQCLYKNDLYLYLCSWNSRAIPLLPLWAVRPVRSLSACTRVTLNFTFGHERVGLYLYSPYGPFGLYGASVPVRGWPLPLPFYPLFLSNLNV